MTDLEVFSAKDFDPRAWINQILARPSQEPVERHLAEVEMRLHLTAEDVEAALQEQSRDAVYRIPAAVLEVSHIKGDLVSLKQGVHKQLQQLDVHAVAAANSVALLKEVDRVKGRMEAACSTLKEATELSQLFQSIEGAFAAGELQKIADMLATMRRSLKLVGHVPEFSGGMQRLQGLEERFLRLIEPKLAAALSQKNGERVQQLSAMLLGIQCYDTVEKLYITARMAPLQAAWDGFDRGGLGPTAPAPQQEFPSWLPDFLEVILAATNSELRWCAAVLPDLHPHLVLHLLRALFAKISKSFRSRLMSACAQGMQQSGQVLSVLVNLKDTAEGFAQELHHNLAGVEASELHHIASALYSPFESQISRYRELQQPQVGSHMAAIPIPDAQTDEAEAVVSALQKAVAQAIQVIEEAQKWCHRVSGGTELPALLSLADAAMSQFIVSVQAVVTSLRLQALKPETQIQNTPGSHRLTRELSEVGGGTASRGSQEGEPPSSMEDPTSMVALLNVTALLSGQLSALEGSLRTAVLSLTDLIDQVTGPDPAPTLNMAALRLQQNQGGALEQMQGLVQQAVAPDWHPLPQAVQRAAACQEGVHALVFDVLMDKVKTQLQGTHTQPVWAAQDAESGISLPSFNAYPQLSVTAAGEYLMMLPQLLESLLPESEEGTDTEWLDKVASGAADLYAAEVQQIGSLTPHGTQQLLADLEYFCNVLAALGVALPPSLSTWQVALGWPLEGFTHAAKAALEARSVDPASLQKLAQARKAQIEM
ncbi:hypothetical protein ABBQ38_007602 [Trebouxia sp. C0009 RCD-2024]